jgi:hypothetical protein
VPLLERPWLEQLGEEADPGRMIELWVANSRRVLGRVAPLMTVIRGTVGSEPELAAQWNFNEQQRPSALRALAEILDQRHLLRPDLAVEEAADLAFLSDSGEGYFLATTTLGWPPQRWEQTVIALLRTTLLAGASAPGTAGGT